MSRSRFRWLLLGLLLFAFLLRAWDLGGKSIWLDEAFSVWHSGRGQDVIWSEIHDNHPPGYYLMLQYWKGISEHESWVRLPSVFTSMLSLALTAALAWRLFSRRTAVTAAVLLTVAPLSIWYAQEARMVIFVAPFALLIGYGLVRGGWRGGLMLFSGLGGGLYFDYTIIPLWVVLSGLWLGDSLLRKRINLAKFKRPFIIWLISSLAGWLLFLPLWSHLALVVGRLGNIFVIANFREQFGLPDLGGLLYVLALIGLGVAAFVGVWLWQRLVERPRLCSLLTAVILAGFVLLTVLTPIPRLYSVKRLVVTGWPLVIILVAVLFGWLRPRYSWVIKGVLAVSLVAVCVSLWLVPKDDWRGAVGYINEHGLAGDAVWLAPASGQIPYNYYKPELESVIGTDLMDDPPTGEIWHIAERQPGTPVPNGVVEVWLEANRPLLEVVPFYRLEVRHYGKE